MEQVQMDIPSGFIYRDETAVSAKLADFTKAGRDMLHILFDFDGTITTYEHEGKVATTWQVLRNSTPPEAQAAALPVYQKYRALEIAGKLTPEDADAWVSDSLGRFVEDKVNLKAVADEFFQKLNLREGTEDLFGMCKENDIPTVILSVGIKDFLEMLCDRYGLEPSVILSADAQLDEDGRMIGWDPATVIHMHNKRERGHGEISKISSSRLCTILIGDSLADANMADGDEHVLRIRVYDPRKDEMGDRDRHIEQSFEAGFDLVFEGSFDPVINLLRNIVSTG